MAIWSTVYACYTFDFRCARPIEDIRSVWISVGPFQWQAWENDQYGTYISVWLPEYNGKLRVLGDAPNYSLEIYFDVDRGKLKQTRSHLFSTIFKKLLPVVGATDVRDTSWQTTRWHRRWLHRLLRRFR